MELRDALLRRVRGGGSADASRGGPEEIPEETILGFRDPTIV